MNFGFWSGRLDEFCEHQLNNEIANAAFIQFSVAVSLIYQFEEDK